MSTEPDPSNTQGQPEPSFNVEQSLPHVPEDIERHDHDSPRRRWLLLTGLCFLLCILMAVAITLIVTLGNKGSGEGDSYESALALLSDNGVSSASDIQNEGSPQNLALRWILDEDKLQLDVPTSFDDEGYNFLMRYVLAVMFFAMKGSEWKHEAGFLGEDDTCGWLEFIVSPAGDNAAGIICDASDRVTAFLLDDLNLRGSIPSEIGSLTSLQILQLGNNKITGYIPESFTKLTALTRIECSNNDLRGTIPSFFGRYINLESLALSNNDLTGTLPSELGSFPSLQHLLLDHNDLSGDVNLVFGSETNIFNGLQRAKNVVLEGNSFSGALKPDFLKNALNLQTLDISENQFTGSLPAHFLAMPTLRVLDAHGNGFTDGLPQNIEENSSLQVLALQQNKLSGEIPKQLSALRKLTHLDISDNQFTNLPPDLMEMTDLRIFFAAKNNFPAGPFPQFVSSLTNLEELSLKSTQITGEIPTYLGELLKLILLDLDDNELEGSIPTELGSLTDLQFLLLNRNNLTDAIPTQLDDLYYLRVLFLDSNSLSGDLSPICDVTDTIIVADCGGDMPLVSCSCCNKCCSKNDPCNTDNLVASVEPTWHDDYDREDYTFGDFSGILEKVAPCEIGCR